MQVFIPIEHAEFSADAGALVPFRFGVARLCALREGFVVGADGGFDFLPLDRDRVSDESPSRRPDGSPAYRPDRR